MGNKVKFGEGASHIVELQQTVSSERQQANDAIRKHTRMQIRIRAFYDAIEYVSFSSADDSPVWASNWLNWLLDGIVPVPDKVEETAATAEAATAEAVPEDQPTLATEDLLPREEGVIPDDEPDDEPPAPTAAVA